MIVMLNRDIKLNTSEKFLHFGTSGFAFSTLHQRIQPSYVLFLIDYANQICSLDKQIEHCSLPKHILQMILIKMLINYIVKTNAPKCKMI